MEQPNIIFIFSDQQRWDTLGCYGQQLPISPNLDKLAEKGVLFEHAFTPQPVCGPARSCLQTGLYATQTGCYRNGIALDVNDQQTIARLMSKAGYEVGYIGKWHLASTSGESAEDLEPRINYRDKAIPPERRGGYDDFWLAADVLEHTSHGPEGGHMWDEEMNQVDFKGYRVDGVTNFVIDYLKSRDGKKPFFLFLSYLEPHHQNDRNIFEGPEGSKNEFKNYQVPGDLEGKNGDWKEQLPDYLGCCYAIDKNIGRINQTLQELGIKQNTLLIYTSDHACHFRTRNSEYKRSCHENSIHVPMIINGPGFSGGLQVNQLVSLLDLVPTVLQAGKAAIPSRVQGKPLQMLIDSPKSTGWPDAVLVQVSESQVGRAIRTGKWKYCVVAPGLNGSYHAKSNFYVESFLYDLDQDIDEKNNLVHDPEFKLVRNELKKILIEKMKEAGESEPIIVSSERIPANDILKVYGRIHKNEEGNLIIGIIPALRGATN